jgi:hypothetical protein
MYIAITLPDGEKCTNKYLKLSDLPHIPNFLYLTEQIHHLFGFSQPFELFWIDQRGLPILLTKKMDLIAFFDLNKEEPYELLCVPIKTAT